MSIFDRDSEYKMVILMRQDLKMSKGKSAAQACHAAVSCSFAAKKKVPSKFAAWDGNGAKISVLKVDGERDLFEFKAIAEAQGMVCSIVCDAGRTEVEPGSYTCLAIGPEKQADLDKITGDLKML
ncbi:MAG: peptidyl-tRNA hydrolase Pth2 [archaeon]|nr:peptidyl-tRNA hydrolase Pth2 [archaeon]